MAKDEFEGLPVIDAPDSENITVVVKPETIWPKAIWPTPKGTPLRLRCAAARASTMRVRRSEKC